MTSSPTSLSFMIPVIVSATVVLALINWESPLISTTKAKATEYRCSPKSLSEVKLDFPVKEPTYIPEGYRLEVVDPYSFSLAERSEDSHRVVLYYSKEPMCHGIIPNGFSDDVIAINVVSIQSKETSSTIKDVDMDPLAFYTKEIEEYNSVIAEVAKSLDKPVSAIPPVSPVQLIKVNDYIGIAREPTQAYTIGIMVDGIINETIIEEHDYKRAGFVEFYHSKDKVIYTINSILPVEEMLKIAESIP